MDVEQEDGCGIVWQAIALQVSPRVLCTEDVLVYVFDPVFPLDKFVPERRPGVVESRCQPARLQPGQLPEQVGDAIGQLDAAQVPDEGLRVGQAAEACGEAGLAVPVRDADKPNLLPEDGPRLDVAELACEQDLPTYGEKGAGRFRRDRQAADSWLSEIPREEHDGHPGKDEAVDVDPDLGDEPRQKRRISCLDVLSGIAGWVGSQSVRHRNVAREGRFSVRHYARWLGGVHLSTDR